MIPHVLHKVIKIGLHHLLIGMIKPGLKTIRARRFPRLHGRNSMIHLFLGHWSVEIHNSFFTQRIELILHHKIALLSIRLGEQVMIEICCMELNIFIFKHPIPIIITKHMDAILLLTTCGLHLLIMGIAVTILHPLYSTPLKPHEFLLVENLMKFAL